jgi:hypothetical protein
MQIYLSRMLIVAVGVVGAGSAGCGNNTPPPPSQYLSFKYTITPPGTGTTTDALVLPINDVSTICDRGNKKISLFGSLGAASVALTLTGTATMPFQTSLNADFRTPGVAQVDMALPLAFDSMGVGRNPVMFSTVDQAQGLLCTFNLPAADYFSMLNGTFTCTSSQTGMPRRLDLIDGMIVSAPCPAGQ